MPEPIVASNEESLRSDLRELVRKTVEDTLNGLLEAGADELVGAGRYERTAEREAYRAGHHGRGPAASSGEVTIHMPKLKGARLATAAIERYRRRETSVEEAMIEMYLAGVSTRRIEDASEILRGPGVSAAAVSDLNEKAFASVGEWRNPAPGRARPCACADGIYPKRSRGGAYENVAVMIAVGVDDDGYREVAGVAEGLTESSAAPAGIPVLAAVPRPSRRADGRRRQGVRHGRLDRGGVPGGRLPAPRASTATCPPGCRSPGAPRSRPCSRRPAPWSRAGRPRPRRSPSRRSSRGCAPGRPRGSSAPATPRP